jgi:hypothetical protein
MSSVFNFKLPFSGSKNEQVIAGLEITSNKDITSKVSELSLAITEKEASMSAMRSYINTTSGHLETLRANNLSEEEAHSIVKQIKTAVFNSHVFPKRASIEDLKGMLATNNQMWNKALREGPVAKKLEEKIKEVQEKINNFEDFKRTIEKPEKHGLISSSAKAFASMIESRYYEKKTPLTGESHFNGKIDSIYRKKITFPKNSKEYKKLDAKQIELTKEAQYLENRVVAARRFRELYFTDHLKDLPKDTKNIFKRFIEKYEPEKTELKAQLQQLQGQRAQIDKEAAFRVSAHQKVYSILKENISMQTLSEEIEDLTHV